MGDKNNIPKLSEKDSLLETQNSTFVAMKMDFFLFIKSFELICKKVYPEKGLNEAMDEFLEKV